MNIKKILMGAALAVTLSVLAAPSASAQSFGLSLGGHHGGFSISVGHGYYGGYGYGYHRGYGYHGGYGYGGRYGYGGGYRYYGRRHGRRGCGW